MTKARFLSHLALFFQIIFALLFGWLSVYFMAVSFQKNSFAFVQSIYDFLPCLTVCVSSLVTEIVLTIKHKSHISEREFLPILFLLVTLQNILVLPKLYVYEGIYPLYYIPFNVYIVAARFLLIMVATVFLLSSLTMQGATLPKTSTMSLMACLVALAVALLIPNDTNFAVNLGGNDIYNSIFVILILVIFVISVVLNLFTIFSNDVTNKNVKKNTGFIFMIMAEVFIVINFNVPNLPLVGVGFYIISNILLIASSSSY
jgi:hypothetical protein